MQQRIKWTTVIAVLLMVVGVGTAGVATMDSPTNWAGVAFGLVLTLAGIGVAVLSLHER